MSKRGEHPQVPLRALAVFISLSAFACATTTTPHGGAPRGPGVPYQDEMLSGATVKVSDHVWSIIGFPNVGIIVGESGTLVVDTGLCQRNGTTVAEAAEALAPHNRLYVTTTHFHPEHAGGIL